MHALITLGAKEKGGGEGGSIHGQMNLVDGWLPINSGLDAVQGSISMKRK
jgi:hypothetical protein